MPSPYRRTRSRLARAASLSPVALPAAAQHGAEQPAGGVGVVERERPLPAGAEDQQLAPGVERVAGGGDRRRQVRRGARGRPPPPPAWRGGPACRWSWSCTSVRPRTARGRHLERAVAEVRSRGSGGRRAPRARSTSGAPMVCASRSASSVRGDGEHGARAVVQRGADDGGGPEDVDDEDRPARRPARAGRPSGEKTTSSFMPRVAAGAARARGTWCPPRRPRSRDGG